MSTGCHVLPADPAKAWLRRLDHMPAPSRVLVVTGGAAHTAGVAFCAARRMRFAHLVWRLFVLAGTTLHFFAVLLYAGRALPWRDGASLASGRSRIQEPAMVRRPAWCSISGGRPARAFLALAIAAVLAAACAAGPPAELDTLVRRDSTYLAPGTLEPFSGPVVRHFADAPDKVQIEGTLRDGTWEGELTVYHRSGRIRYQGAMHAGAQCGAWVENREDEAAESVYQLLKQDVESLSLYPECPEG